MNKEEIDAVLRLGHLTYFGGNRKKEDFVEFVYANWDSLLRNIKRDHVPQTTTPQTSNARGSEEVPAVAHDTEDTSSDATSDGFGNCPTTFDIEGSDTDDDSSQSDHSLDGILEGIFDEIRDPDDITIDDYDTGNLPEEYLKDSACFDGRDLAVVVNQVSGKQLLVIPVISDKKTTDDLKEAIMTEIENRVAKLTKPKAVEFGVDDFKLKNGNFTMKPDEHLADHCDDDQNTLYVTMLLKLRGGAPFLPTRKDHLKKDQAVSKLKSKLAEKFKGDDIEDVQTYDLPDAFIQFLNSQKDKKNQMLALRARLGASFVKTCLRSVPLDDLKTIIQIFGSNRGIKGVRHLTQEEKVVKSLALVYPQLDEMGKCVSKLNYEQRALMMEVLGIFAEEYFAYSPQGGTVSLDAAQFVEQVKHEVRRREDDGAGHDDEAVANSCQIQ
eukprot:Skav214963  [mRNA]  locus=scaffold264:176182:177498:+ [translate_table: standard]